MEKKWVVVISIVAFIILVVAVYFTFFFKYSCQYNDVTCFRVYQGKCTKAFVENEVEGLVWDYKILGEKDNSCLISAEVVKVTTGTLDKKALEGKSMECEMPIGSLALPDSDLTRCHGELKEELQGLIINKLHAYILSNVKEIGSELADIIKNETK